MSKRRTPTVAALIVLSLAPMAQADQVSGTLSGYVSGHSLLYELNASGDYVLTSSLYVSDTPGTMSFYADLGFGSMSITTNPLSWNGSNFTASSSIHEDPLPATVDTTFDFAGEFSSYNASFTVTDPLGQMIGDSGLFLTAANGIGSVLATTYADDFRSFTELSLQFQSAGVPEPSSVVLAVMGIGGVLFCAWRSRRKRDSSLNATTSSRDSTGPRYGRRLLPRSREGLR
jgi:hypothetical protein